MRSIFFNSSFSRKFSWHKSLITAFLLFSLHAGPLFSAVTSGRILHLVSRSNLEKALELYKEQKKNDHDYELLQNIGFTVLNRSISSYDAEELLTALLGASLSGNDQAIGFLRATINNNNPLIQVATINLLSRFQNDEAIYIINQAMRSDFLLVRLEALYHLVKNKDPKATGQLLSLLEKSPKEFLLVFPHLLAMSGDSCSMRALRRLLANSDEMCKIACIHAIAEFHRDDFTEEIRAFSAHLSAAEQEACAFALKILKDEGSLERLKKLSSSNTISVKLASLLALYSFGELHAKEEIEKLAKQEDPFAIFSLGAISESRDLLETLMRSSSATTRVNATLALLQLKSPAVLEGLKEICIKDFRDLGFKEFVSQGRTLKSWKAVPSSTQNYANDPDSLSAFLNLRKECLIEAFKLPESVFLSLAKDLFDKRQYDLIPLLVTLLADSDSKDAILLLKEQRKRLGEPMIRSYCNLALYKAKKPGPYKDELKAWIAAHFSEPLIRFHPSNTLNRLNSFQMAPEDVTMLLVDSLEAMIQALDEDVVDLLLDAIQYGNSKNRPVLAGLLIRATQ